MRNIYNYGVSQAKMRADEQRCHRHEADSIEWAEMSDSARTTDQVAVINITM